MPCTPQQKVFCATLYFASKSFKFVKKKFEIKFKTHVSPTKARTRAWLLKLQTHGTVENLNAKSPARASHSGGIMSARTPDNVAVVKASVTENPCMSSRHRSQTLGIGHCSLGNILQKDLHYTAYTIQTKHQLTETDKKKRIETCAWFQARHFSLFFRFSRKMTSPQKPLEKPLEQWYLSEILTQ